MWCIAFLFAVVTLAKAQLESFDGYHYPKPETKLCSDGTIRAFCDETQYCPSGFLGVFPNCYPPKLICPEGTHLETSFHSGDQCILDVSVPYYPPQQCPLGTVGMYPDCQRQIIQQECPFGTTGTYPYCQSRVYNCPIGTTGIYPDCQILKVNVCPLGTVGTYPHCNVPLRASEGYHYPKPNIPFTF